MPINSVINSIRLHDGGGGVLAGFTTLDVVFQCHGRCGVSCGGLGALDVFGDIVNISEDRCTETPRLDRFGKVDFLLDSGTHPADLDVGQGFLPTQHKMMGERGQQVFFNLRHKCNRPLACFGLWFAYHSQVAGWMSDRPLDVDGVSIEVEVLPLETKHFFGAKRMQRRQSDVSPVPVAADVVNVGEIRYCILSTE